MEKENEKEKEKAARVKVINERIVETSLMCTCDYQPWACQSCDFDGWVGQRITDKEAVIRKRFRKNHSSDEDDEADQMGSDEQLKTSDYDPDTIIGFRISKDIENDAMVFILSSFLDLHRELGPEL